MEDGCLLILYHGYTFFPDFSEKSLNKLLVFFSKVAVHPHIPYIFVRDGWGIAALVERHNVIQGILQDSIIFFFYGNSEG